ncbi:hypothetical protein [Bradyrhizobium zhanjiangense]|uniref:hypothetical protein n=1 Tax=Bradyrhizobium zhanjiangense TaxID=1325107 RepID=UPI00100918F1|nr:hypothetical protein [Bradyrhizobium zhanjiangense]
MLVAASVATSQFFTPVATMSIANESIKVYGVNVYLGPDPKCEVSNFNREIRTRVAPFEQSASLGEIIGELALLARAQGANMLHSIRVLSAVPYQGADVAGVAVRCEDADSAQATTLPTRDKELAVVVKAATGAVVYALPDAADLGPERSIDHSRLVMIRELDAAATEQLRNLIASADPTTGPVKSCPFAPSIAFKFTALGTEAWWLVSYNCETAILARRNDNWRGIQPLNLKADVLAAFQNLAK